VYIKDLEEKADLLVLTQGRAVQVDGIKTRVGRSHGYALES